jgi:hypothetical protein
MTATSEKPGVPPSAATDAVLVPSNEMPKGSKKVEGIDFNKLAGGPITIDDLMSGMTNMGFQASSIGEAVRIINDMVTHLPLSTHSSSNINREPGVTPKNQPLKQPSSSATHPT